MPCRCVQPWAGACTLAQGRAPYSVSGAGELSAFQCKLSKLPRLFRKASMRTEPEGLEPYSSKATYAGVHLGSPQVSQEQGSPGDAGPQASGRGEKGKTQDLGSPRFCEHPESRPLKDNLLFIHSEADRPLSPPGHKSLFAN